ncbi:MAG: acyltransferase [Desulfovibrionaceae bacterium]|nr:acyltransferase [Desulfovibrionaceae bacterium]MBF0515336.1 acyltransferase [Desulfovibrionaceae bacterium]
MIQKNIPELTACRALAAFAVLIQHGIDVSFTYSGKLILHSYVAPLGYIGMSIFFVLSGFVITYNYSHFFYEKKWLEAFKYFSIARFSRLYPLYFIFFILSLNYMPSPQFNNELITYLSYLTLTQCWFNLEMTTFNVAWSISSECFFYLAFAVFALFPFRSTTSRSRKIEAVLVSVGIVGLLYFLFCNQEAILSFLIQHFSHRSYPGDNVWIWFEYNSPYMRIFDFIVGTYAARIFLADSKQNTYVEPTLRVKVMTLASLSAIAFLLMCSAFTLFAESFLFFLTKNFAYSPFLAYLIYASARYKNFVSRFLTNKWLIAAGEISYSVYIVQAWTISLVTYSSPAPMLLGYFNSCVKFALILVLTTAFGYGSYNVLEIPSRKFLRNRLHALFS